MSEHDEDAVVERIAADWGVWDVDAKLVLSALKPGDHLPGGLIVVPEEAAVAMIKEISDVVIAALAALDD